MWVSHDSIGRVCPLKLLHQFASPHAMVKVTTALGACSPNAHLCMQFCTPKLYHHVSILPLCNAVGRVLQNPMA